MKKFFLSLILSMAAFAGANAMSFSRAQAEALYLTDKMAYELNLNDQQYNDAYEINLDYFLRMESPSDAYGYYYDYRLSDLRCILHDWQYSLLLAADYFLRPITWRAGGWFFPIYSYYDRGSFFYGRPRVWVTYRGGHSRFYHSAGFYMHRRPVWNGGLRGRDMGPHHGGMHGRSGGMVGRGGMRGGSGRGYHFDLNGRQGGGSNRQHQGGSNYGNHQGGSNYGNHQGGSNYGQHQGGSNYGRHSDNSSSHNAAAGQHGSSRSGIISGSPVGRGNSFDGSSSRTGGSRGSYQGSGVSRSYSGGSSRGSGMTRSYSGGSGSSMGSSRGSGMTRSYSGGSGSNGGSRGVSHGSGMSGGGSSRGGRR